MYSAGLKVYVAGPYSNGDVDAMQAKVKNTENAMDVAEHILAYGHYPFIPHLTHYFDTLKPRGCVSYNKYLEWDLAFLVVCDVLIRLPGASVGADREVAMARAMGMTVILMDPDMDLDDPRQYVEFGAGL